MLRGWIHTHKKGAPTLVLAVLLVVGAALWAQHLKASTLDAAAFERAFVNQHLAVDDSPFDPVIYTFPDGTMRVQTSIGVFDGQWTMVDQTICLFFANGPKMGETCGQIIRVADGVYKTSSGDRLRLILPAS